MTQTEDFVVAFTGAFILLLPPLGMSVSPDFFSRMFILAGDPDRQRELSELLFGELEETGFSSRTWFEHVIDKLTMEMLSQATPAQCLGLLRFIFINGTKISRYYRQRDGIMGLESAGLTELADRLFQLTLNATHRGGSTVLAMPSKIGKRSTGP
ncbi:hypothetical protein [Escherichia coli]|uniref:hypothetical protein n=1 Tax=Escherichia coli TaxID=562 RepID=UPI001891A605|nr:hypothetical protein [Escherichia coli]